MSIRAGRCNIRRGHVYFVITITYKYFELSKLSFQGSLGQNGVANNTSEFVLIS